MVYMHSSVSSLSIMLAQFVSCHNDEVYVIQNRVILSKKYIVL